MRAGISPALTIANLRWENNGQGGRHKTDADSMHQHVHCQQPSVSNICDHIRTLPNFFSIPESHKRRSLIIQEVDKKLQDAYFKPQKDLNSLQNHLETTGNQVKSQAREAAISLLKVMNYYQDDATGRVGRRMDDGKFKDMSLSRLAQLAGIQLKRAKRAMKLIIRAGYMQVVRQWYRAANGDIFALPSLRKFLPKFFTDLDIKGSVWQKLFSLREYKQQRDAKKETKQNRKQARAALGLITETLKEKGKKLTGTFGGMVKKITGQKSNPAEIEHKRQLTQKALEMFNRDPSRSPTEYLKLLQSQYPPPK